MIAYKTYEDVVKTSYKDIIYADDFFLQMGPKNCNTDERSVWTTGVTMLKNKHYLVLFHESILVSL